MNFSYVVSIILSFLMFTQAYGYIKRDNSYQNPWLQSNNVILHNNSKRGLTDGASISLPWCKDHWPAPKYTDPEIHQTIQQIITSKGYPLEEYWVTTEDNYILSLFRIPHGRYNIQNNAKRVVFLQHGLLDSPFAWVLNSPEQSLAFILADEGFDVWMASSRGSTHSRTHKTLSPKKSAFWQFTWKEMAKYDLPACINFVLQKSGAAKLFYVGHSQGSEIAFAKFSEDQELASKIEILFALAPVAFIGNLKSPIKYLAPFADLITSTVELFGTGEFLPSSWITQLLAKHVCDKNVLNLVCTNTIFLIAGYDCKHTNETRLPVYLSKLPSGTSARNVLHHVQTYKAKKFQQFDLGKSENLKQYGQTTPPEFDLTKMKVPTALFYGGEDWLSVPTDVIALRELLPNVIFQKYTNDYDHMDYVWGVNAKTEIYDQIIHMIKTH